MVIMGMVYSVFFFVMAWFLPGLTPGDKERIRKFVPMGRRFVPARPQVDQQ